MSHQIDTNSLEISCFKLNLMQKSTFIKRCDIIRVLRKKRGYTVGQKTVPMFGCFAKIEVEQIKKIRK